MEFQYIFFTFALLSTVVCFPGKSRDHDEEKETFEEEEFFRDQMRRNMLEQRKFLNEKISELTDTLDATLGGKLDHLKEVVEAIERRQKFAAFCTEGICSDNGTCALSDDEETYVCNCDEGYVGEHCEITGPCNVELYQVQQMPPMLGREFPRCDENGRYAGMQFSGSQAFCVTQEKEKIDGYMVNRWETGDDMNCQCARDEYLSEEGKTFNCLPNGNYPQVACDDLWCRCQDWQGQQYGGRVPLGDVDTTLNC
ncbi:uncharacterized protein LOC123561396 [Mercenaria mercenaria]|uniref:uncharacterized protein LOC123561396 n=1 Tax=Mercenaria mercenaria TaxID=6596 RepID=UPI00234FB55A|nr:uncharacterized protein LOC123561396 [Mercenaria mercenaria]